MNVSKEIKAIGLSAGLLGLGLSGCSSTPNPELVNLVELVKEKGSSHQIKGGAIEYKSEFYGPEHSKFLVLYKDNKPVNVIDSNDELLLNVKQDSKEVTCYDFRLNGIRGTNDLVTVGSQKNSQKINLFFRNLGNSFYFELIGIATKSVKQL